LNKISKFLIFQSGTRVIKKIGVIKKLDPPRDGMHKDVIKEILKLETKSIVYVSCNPSTQCRDLELLKEKYDIKKVQPIDMFPHTDHVENVVLLNLRS
jgi:23S rRNA (uracil1939-C5)-methyltransferase